MTQRILPGDQRLALSHLARAYELDPSLRPRSHPGNLALDAATEEQIIARAIRTARAAAPGRPTRRTASMFDPNRLFQRSRAHALDESGSGDAREHIQHARNHIGAVMAGSADLDAERLHRYLTDALAALGATEAEDDETAMWEPGSTAAERHRAMSGAGEADDAIGEVPPRSSVSSRGPRPRVDHRKDFNSRAQGGADGAHGYDRSGFNADALFQRTGTR